MARIKKFRKVMIILGIIVATPLIVLLVNTLFSLYYNRGYIEADKGASSKNYILRKLSAEGRIEYNFDDAAYATGDTIPREGNDGHLYYNTALQKAIIKTQKDISAPGEYNNYLTQFFAIDKNGNISKLDSLPEGTKSVKNQLVPFHKWKDNTQLIYLRHFSMKHFDPPSLNPLHGMGNPTGGHPSYYWDGPGYYDIKINSEIIKVKIPCQSEAFLFPAEYEYYTGLFYYLIPEMDAAFLVYSKTYEPDAVYMIRHK